MRRIFALPVLLCRPASPPARSSAVTTTTGDGAAAEQVVLVTHESFVLPEELVARVRGGVRLRPRDQGVRRRRRADQQAGAHQGQPDRRRGLRHRQHLREPRARRGRARADRRRAGPRRRRVRPRRATAPTTWCRSTPATSASTSTRPGSREQGITPPATLERPDDPAYRDLFVLPGATTSSPGLAFLLDHVAAYGDDWPAYWERPAGQRRQAHRGLVGRLPGRLHPGRRRRRPADRAVLRLLAGLHGRRRGRVDDEGAARHLLPAGRVRRRAGRRRQPRGRHGAGRVPARRPRCRKRCPTRCTSSRSTPTRRCRAPGRLRRAARPTRGRVDPDEIAANRDDVAAPSGATSISR